MTISIISYRYSLLSTNFIRGVVLPSDALCHRAFREFVAQAPQLLSVPARVALSLLFSRLCFRAPLSLFVVYRVTTGRVATRSFAPVMFCISQTARIGS